MKYQDVDNFLKDIDLVTDHLPLASALEDYDFQETARGMRAEAENHNKNPHIQSTLISLADRYEAVGDKVEKHLEPRDNT